MSQVTCENITKRFGALTVLNQVNLAVAQGEFLVLLGPSGCGKSTLLRIIAGLERQDSGSVSIGGEAVDDVHPRARDVAMVFQNYALYPLMTVYQNLAFSLKIRKLPAAEVDAQVRRVADILGLTAHLQHRPAQLSGGQRQRVAMGRAMVRDPRVFLFDEPLSNLDARLRTRVRGEIKSLHLALATTTIYVTHDQIEAMSMGDRIAVMRDGGIEQIGSADEIYTRPANLYVAAFIGSPEINILRGVADGGVFRVGDAKLPLPGGAAVTGEVLYGVRPHDVSLADADSDASVAAKVQFVEPTGGGAIVHAVLHEVDEEVGEIVLQISYDEGKGLSAGDEFKFCIPAEKVHLFDAGSERRISSN